MFNEIYTLIFSIYSLCILSYMYQYCLFFTILVIIFIAIFIDAVVSYINIFSLNYSDFDIISRKINIRIFYFYQLIISVFYDD